MGRLVNAECSVLTGYRVSCGGFAEMKQLSEKGFKDLADELDAATLRELLLDINTIVPDSASVALGFIQQNVPQSLTVGQASNSDAGRPRARSFSFDQLTLSTVPRRLSTPLPGNAIDGSADGAAAEQTPVPMAPIKFGISDPAVDMGAKMTAKEKAKLEKAQAKAAKKAAKEAEKAAKKAEKEGKKLAKQKAK